MKEHVMQVWELFCVSYLVFADLLQHTLNQWKKTRWLKVIEDLCASACFCKRMSAQAHRSAVSSDLLCHTDGNESELQTQLLQQERQEIRGTVTETFLLWYHVVHMELIQQVTAADGRNIWATFIYSFITTPPFFRYFHWKVKWNWIRCHKWQTTSK